MILRQAFHQFEGTEVAVIGMAGRFPGARDLAAFWKNLQQGVESIRFFSEAELKASGVESAKLLEPNFVKACGDLEGFDLFDAGFFGFSPMDAAIMDPQQRVFLECAWEALEDAGYDPQNYTGAVGVFAGSGTNSYMMYNLISNRDLIDSMGRFAVWTMGNDKDFLTTRVSYLLNLKGPSVNVQTACSTSLVAIHMASQSLLGCECDMALAGGVTLLLPQDRGYLYREGEINSPDGHCRAFDAKAKGTVFGSGAGIVVLKRLGDALRDEDNIYAIIKGSAINNDGSSKVGYTAPSVEGQARVITEALEVSNVDPETISYVEAHGTGTPIGDPIEVAALTQAFREKTTQRGFCAIGSLKTNIGHLDTAAGVAGMIKTVMALKHKELPPTLHYETPNPEIDFSGSPFFVNAKLSEWPNLGLPRRAGVSSLGVGGTNAHVILEEAPLREPSGKSRPWQLVLQSARSAKALNQATSDLASHLKMNTDLDLADVAYTLQVGRRSFNHRRMLVVRDLHDAASALENLDPTRVFTQTTSQDTQSVLFMFPGQGSQYINMGRELYEAEPVFRQELDRCFELLHPQLGFDLRELLYPSQNQLEEAASERLLQTAVAQPAIFVIEYALAKLWMTWGVQPAAMIGHSIGEYVAACIAGVFSLENAVSLVAERGRLMQQVPVGAMLAVSLPEEKLTCLLGEDLSLAAVNGPTQCVASGSFEAITALQSHLKEQHIDCRLLHASHAFHSKMMDPILKSFSEKVRQIELRPPKIPYVSNLTGSWITPAQATEPEYWVKHLRQTVRFGDGLRNISEKKWVLLEVGPGKTLGTFAKQPTIGASYSSPIVSSLRHPNDLQSDTAFLLGALGRLWLAGVRADWSGFYAGELRRRVSLPAYPFERQRYWINPGEQAHAATSSKGSLKKQRDVADWFYLHTWKEAPLITRSKLGDLREENAQWLVFANEGDFSSRVVDRLQLERGSLQDKGHPTIAVIPGKQFGKVRPGLYCVNPSLPADYEALLNELAQLNVLPTRIAHLWNVTAAPLEPGTKELEQELALSFYSLLYLAQELGTRELREAVHIGIVATGTSQVAGEALAHPERATVLGACKVISHEFPSIRCKSIDIVLPESGSRQEERLIAQLISEVSADFSSDVIAYRGYQRWVQTFERVRFEQASSGKSLLKQGGTYLITGGLGGIALAIAEYLAKAFQAKLVLVGRRGLPPREHWTQWLESHDDRDTTSGKIRKIEEFERLGAEVVLATADVADADQMRNVVSVAKERFGGIQGVIHAAGVIRDSLIQLKSGETAAEVLEPKVKGTLVLDAVLRGEKLDFFVLFSSVSAITGPVGTVDYSAANAFLNAFAQQKAARDDTYTLAIDWGVWREVGMAAATVAQAEASESMNSKLAGKKGPHPLLARCLVDSADEKVYITELTDRHWVLNEHRFQTGEGVCPGAAYLEIARAALEQDARHKPIEITNVLFLEPLILKPGERRDLRVALKRNGNSFDFVMSSELRSGQRRVHARGSVSYVDSLPARAQLLSAIEAGCNVGERISADLEQNAHVAYGPRWKSIQRARFGNREALLTLELPEAFRSDLEQYKLHPALLDMATGGAHALISGQEKLKDFYVPLSYGKARINAPLPTKLFSHMRVREDEEPPKGVAVFDVTLLDEDGIEIVQISNFVVRQISDTAKMTGETQAAADSQLQPSSGAHYDKRDPISQVLIAAVEQGITPAEGVDAFCRALSSSSPRIVVTSQDLNAVMEETDSAAKALQSRWSGQTETTPALHPRPELPTKFVPAGTEQERRITEIWQELLAIQQVGIHDDFFELGGHSLMIVSVHNRLQQTFNVTFPVAKMFQYPTINALANYLRPGQDNKPSYENVRDRAERQRERQRQLVRGKSTK